MPKCNTCQHYRPHLPPHHWRGACAINLPAWLESFLESYEPSRVVRGDDGCNLHGEKS
jgi:hypothetical protein